MISTPVVTSRSRRSCASADGVLVAGRRRVSRCGEPALEEAGLADAIREVTSGGRPYLGICFGLQLLFDEGTEHGITPGLGQLGGRVTTLPRQGRERRAAARSAHRLERGDAIEGDHPMVEGPAGARHLLLRPLVSPRADRSESIIVGTRRLRRDASAAAVAKGNVFAIQFHPEKSQSAGKRLLDAYRAWLESRADGGEGSTLRTHPRDRSARAERPCASSQGDYDQATVYDADPANVAKRFLRRRDQAAPCRRSRRGEGRASRWPRNRSGGSSREVGDVPVQLGGGLRDHAPGSTTALSWGLDRVILGNHRAPGP